MMGRIVVAHKRLVVMVVVMMVEVQQTWVRMMREHQMRGGCGWLRMLVRLVVVMMVLLVAFLELLIQVSLVLLMLRA